MAKQKQKPVWGWVQTKQSSTPIDAQKAEVTKKFGPLVQKLKQALPPVDNRR